MRITSSSKVKNSSRSESKGKKERKLQIRIDFNFYDDDKCLKCQVKWLRKCVLGVQVTICDLGVPDPKDDKEPAVEPPPSYA